MHYNINKTDSDVCASAPSTNSCFLIYLAVSIAHARRSMPFIPSSLETEELYSIFPIKKRIKKNIELVWSSPHNGTCRTPVQQIYNPQSDNFLIIYDTLFTCLLMISGRIATFVP